MDDGATDKSGVERRLEFIESGYSGKVGSTAQT